MIRGWNEGLESRIGDLESGIGDMVLRLRIGIVYSELGIGIGNS